MTDASWHFNKRARTAEGMGAFKQDERGVGCITSLTSVNSDVERIEVAVPDVVPRPQERTSSY
jgi:hypothetical protein